MSDESKAPVDLSSIGNDLSQMFRPSWTMESADTAAHLAAKFDEGHRPERSERGGHRIGNRGRDAGGPRGPRGERGGPGGRSSRGEQGGRKGGPRREGGRDRREGRGPREERERRPELPPKPMLEGWKLQLIPEAAAIEGITKQIRSRAKAYPLFELARLIVKLSDRYSIKLQAEGESSSELFRVKLDGSLWLSRKEALSHLLSKHVEKFYRRSSITTEAPKGAFSVVAQCGMSGVLLGPPNHHEYTSRLIALHASRFKNVPFEIYKSRIRMMRDEALIEQWKTEQSTKTVFIPLAPGSQSPAPVEETAVIEPSGEGNAPQNTPSEEILPSAAAETVTEEAVSSLESESTSEEPLPSLEAESSEEVASSEVETSQVSEVSEGGLSLAEVFEHFNEHHAADEIEVAGSEIHVAGAVALHGSSAPIRELLLKNLQEMDRFPLPLAQVLGKELTNRGLQLFKSHKKIINVSVARPHYLDRETTPVGEGFRCILDYLEAHPKQHRDKQWSALLALRKETVSSVEEVVVKEEPATKTTDATKEAETLKLREQALATDLLWLLHQGHVIDFAMGNLQAATRPAPKPEAKKESSQEKNKEASEVVGASTASEGEENLSAESVKEHPVAEEKVVVETAPRRDSVSETSIPETTPE